MNAEQMAAFYPLSLRVRRLFHKLGHGAAALHAGSQVSVGMRAVLESVIDGGPQTVPHMARVRPVTRQHIQGLVNQLMVGGYVEAVENPHHKRSKLIAPTRLGREAFAALRQRENAAFEMLDLAVTPEELSAAASVLAALIAAFESPAWQEIVAHLNPKTED